MYLIFLALIGIPAFLCEILIGKTTQKPPTGAFKELGKTKTWGSIGTLTIWTGFLVSSFYSVVAGWILGYLIESLTLQLASISTLEAAHTHYTNLMAYPFWGLWNHALFMGVCLAFLLGGIRKGIELCNKIFMPLFFGILLLLAGYAATLSESNTVLASLATFSFADLPHEAYLIALGHAFFTLSVGQGTLVTYGSYLQPKEKILSNSLFVIGADTIVSLLTAFSVITIVASAGMTMEFGPGLIFETLPTVFHAIPGGTLLLILFFFLVFIAALTSQVSALEPMIAHLTTRKKLSRKRAVALVTTASFLLGVPSALPHSGMLPFMNSLTTSFLIPIGGFAAVLLVGWRWGAKKALQELHVEQNPFRHYFYLTFRYVAPLLIAIVFAHSLYSAIST